MIWDSNLAVIDDSNYAAFIDPTVDNTVMKCASRGVWSPGLCAGYRGDFADLGVPLIPEDQWRDRARMLEKNNRRIPDLSQELGLDIRSQGDSNYCWVFGTMRSAECNLMQEGVVGHISPFSVGAYVKNFRNVGGWGDQAMDYGARAGFNWHDEWPADGGSRSISRRYATEENKRLAAQRKFLEYYRVQSWAEVVSSILQGFAVAVGYNWWSHLVCATWLTTDLDLGIDNSWGPNWSNGGRGILSGRRKYPDGAVVITGTMAI